MYIIIYTWATIVLKNLVMINYFIDPLLLDDLKSYFAAIYVVYCSHPHPPIHPHSDSHLYLFFTIFRNHKYVIGSW